MTCFPKIRLDVLALGALAVVGACGGNPCIGGFCDRRMGDIGTKAEDLGYFLVTQRAEEATAGNMVLGQSGPLDGNGRVALDFHATHMARITPGLTGVTVNTDGTRQTASEFPTADGRATSIGASVALGITRGFKVGDTRVFGIDVLGNLTEYQGFGASDLHITADGTFGTGLGVRLGLLHETHTLPGITYSVMKRWLPSLSFHSDPISDGNGGTATLGESDIGITVMSRRLGASKQFGALGVTAGAGVDLYEGNGQTVGTILPAVGIGNSATRDSYFYTERRNLFAGASWTLKPATIVAEVGRLSSQSDGGHMGNTFAGRTPEEPRTYVSIGVRIGTKP